MVVWLGCLGQNGTAHSKSGVLPVGDGFRADLGFGASSFVLCNFFGASRVLHFYSLKRGKPGVINLCL